MDYKIVTHKDTSTVEKEVNKLLKKGYHILGSLINFQESESGINLFAQVCLLEDVLEKASEPKKQHVDPNVQYVENLAIKQVEPAKTKASKSKVRPSNDIQQVSVNMITAHAFVEILKTDGRIAKFILKDCRTPSHIVQQVVTDLYTKNRLTAPELLKNGVQFSGLAAEAY